MDIPELICENGGAIGAQQQIFAPGPPNRLIWPCSIPLLDYSKKKTAIFPKLALCHSLSSVTERKCALQVLEYKGSHWQWDWFHFIPVSTSWLFKVLSILQSSDSERGHINVVRVNKSWQKHKQMFIFSLLTIKSFVLETYRNMQPESMTLELYSIFVLFFFFFFPQSLTSPCLPFQSLWSNPLFLYKMFPLPSFLHQCILSRTHLTTVPSSGSYSMLLWTTAILKLQTQDGKNRREKLCFPLFSAARWSRFLFY